MNGSYNYMKYNIIKLNPSVHISKIKQDVEGYVQTQADKVRVQTVEQDAEVCV